MLLLIQLLSNNWIMKLVELALLGIVSNSIRYIDCLFYLIELQNLVCCHDGASMGIVEIFDKERRTEEVGKCKSLES